MSQRRGGSKGDVPHSFRYYLPPRFNYNKSFALLGFLIVPGTGFYQTGVPYRGQYLPRGTLLDGLGYSPRNGNLSAGLPESGTIQIFNPANLQAVNKLTLAATFPPPSFQPFSDSILRFSADGSILFFTVGAGIDYIMSN